MCVCYRPLRRLINCATRTTLTSSSIINLIIVSESDNNSQLGLSPIGLNDYKVIYGTSKLYRVKIGTHKSIKLRSCKHYDRVTFNDKLSAIDWNGINSSTHVEN